MESDTPSIKNGNLEIDIFKFLFSIVVVLCHCIYWGGYRFKAGALAVEFFFIVSGFLFTKKVLADEDDAAGWKYIVRSVKNLTPFLAAGMIISLCWHFCFCNWTKQALFANFILSVIGELLHFQMFGLPMFSSTGVVWYLSAMYIGMGILSLFLKKSKNSFPTLPLLLIVMFIYGWLCQKRGNVRGPGDWLGNCFVGTLRGIAGISLGALCYRFTLFLRNFGFNFKGRILLSIVEFCLYLHSAFYMWRKESFFYDFYILFYLFIAVAITFSELSLFSFVNKWKAPFFRRASICILFSHFYVVQYFEKIFPQFTGAKAKVIVTLQVVLLSVLNYFLAGLIKRVVAKFIKAIRTESAA